ncbi:hypothetical protein [Paracoccus yeei]|uniref:hypothetical protein n=1 Tax=Paracoccus yeei TaxID=147645 RepID=UPI001C8D5828|nr:hypothetical protein [Paracoccus yeei]MBY0137152.1 hypothetical protein [Paracoccus yeei]
MQPPPTAPPAGPGSAPAGAAQACRFGRIEDARLFGRAVPRRIEVELLPAVTEVGNGFLLACRVLSEPRRPDLRISISFQRAQIWHDTTGPEVLALLAALRAEGPLGSDTPVLRMTFEGAELERTLMSERGRKYSFTVFEAARWFYRRDGRPVTGGLPVQVSG